jgi:outer membrane immunogenic protein
MRKFLLTTVALSSHVAPAVAADLAARPYTKAPPMMMAPAYDWSGFYIGANAGYGFSDNNRITTSGQSAINVTNVNGGARRANVGLNRDGFVGGGQLGYNWQTGRNIVFGIEADIAYTNFNRNTNVVTVPLNGIGTLNNNFSSRMDYFGTVRGRMGYTWGATMLYGTGGLAYGEVNNSASFFGPAGQLQFFGRNSGVRTGYTVGGGIEHMFAPNWSVKAEYLYYDLGDSNLNVAVVPGGGGGGSGYNTRFHNEGNIVRAGINYKFGGPAVSPY